MLEPYLMWIKIAGYGVAVIALITICWSIRNAYRERDELEISQGVLRAQLITEQQKVIVAMEQLKIWQDTVEKMNRAIKNIKVEANTYVEQTLKEPKPVIPAGGSVPLVLSGVSANSTMPKFEAQSTSRVRPNAAASGLVPVR